MQQQLKGSITFLVSEKGTTIEIMDNLSRERFVTITITPEDTCRMFGRLAYIPCELDIDGLDRVGKKMKIDHIVFEMPKCEYKAKSIVAQQLAEKNCPEGWKADMYFGSKDSFFQKDGKEYAKTTIRKWE